MSQQYSDTFAAGKVRSGSMAAGLMAQPVYLQLRKYPYVPAITFRATNGHPYLLAFRITLST